jgi:hypothetical protein
MELIPLEPAYEDMKTSHRSPQVGDANILVTAPNFVASKACCTDFGATVPGIIVIHKDSRLVPEPELLATIFALDHHE